MEPSRFHTSSRVRTKYFKALEQLLEQLNQTWKRVFPPEARFPRETCEGFFEPFVQFGVALYDAYAEELLDSNPPHEQYLQALNFDLKSLVCNQIYPYREKPIRTFQDALDASARGELSDEWTVRMREAWHLFEHPRHSANQDRVYREFIDVYGYMPVLWGRLFDRIHRAISRRTIHWLSAHAERAAALEAGFPKPDQAGATEASGDESTRTDAGQAGNGTNAGQSDGKGRKRGPKSDHEAVSRVAEMVARVAPNGDWRPKLDDICEALDEARIPFPLRWRQRVRSCKGWVDYDERANAVKAIEYRLGLAKQRKKTSPETLS